jgi:hypothetical protein
MRLPLGRDIATGEYLPQVGVTDKFAKGEFGVATHR